MTRSPRQIKHQAKRQAKHKASGSVKPPPKSRQWRWRALLGGALKWLLVAGIWGAVAVGAIVVWYAMDLPDIDQALATQRPPTVAVLAADGAPLLRVGGIYGAAVQVNDLPPALPHAVLATEDRRFYRHFGLDILGLARATVANLRAGGIVQGGSTITQQLAKNLFLTPKRTLKRKVQELLLALWLENLFTKDQILTIYLNRVYLGAGTYGVDAAARRYFDVPARRVSLYQGAMLAGLLKAPTRYSPEHHPRRAHRRTVQVLANMVDAGYLSPEDAAAAGRLKKGTARVSPSGRSGRYFADWVLAQLPGYVSPGNRDLTVHTTLDRRLQVLAENAVESGLAGPGKAAGVSQSALVALAPDGAVRAMVGGRDYRRSQFNRATQALRQPGSAFKPIVYGAGLEAGLAPDTPFVDAPITVDGWTPRNFQRRHVGDVTMQTALARSINTVAVRVAERAGRDRVVAMARRLGITATLRPEPSLALGTAGVSLLELTAAYGAFATGGIGVWAHGIEEIRGAKGQVLYKRTGSGPGRVLTPETAHAMNTMLTAVIATGTGRAAALPRPVAGKTGTSQSYRDAWFVGYSADLITGVWMGNDDERPMNKVTGGGLPAKMWRRFMIGAHDTLPARPLPGLDGYATGMTPGTGAEPSFWQKIFGTSGN